MNQTENITAPKVNVITSQDVINKPFTDGASILSNMKLNHFVRTNITNAVSGVYMIQSLTDKKRYIGSTKNFRSRKWDHFKSLQEGTHYNPGLQEHYNKYGSTDLKFSIIDPVIRFFDEEPSQFKIRLIEREQHWIDILKPEFNLSPTAYSCLGVKRSKEFKEKISKNNPSKRPEVKQKQSKARKEYWDTHEHPFGEKNPFYKKIHTKETCTIIGKKNSVHMKGNQYALGNKFSHTTEELEKMVNLWKNPDYRKGQSKSRKGRIPWNKGLKETYHIKTAGIRRPPHLEKTKNKISEGIKKYFEDPIHKKERSESSKKGWVSRKINNVNETTR